MLSTEDLPHVNKLPNTQTLENILEKYTFIYEEALQESFFQAVSDGKKYLPCTENKLSSLALRDHSCSPLGFPFPKDEQMHNLENDEDLPQTIARYFESFQYPKSITKL